MSDLKISQLDELFNPYSSDVIPIVHQGITKKTPISTIVRHLSVVLEDNGGVYLGSNYKSASGYWEDTYTNVLANSAQWAIDSGDVNVNTTVKSNSANWQSTYNTFKAVSSTFLTFETDSQTLSFNETNKNLSISNGNVVSLSALVDGTAVDTAVRALTANYNSTYNTVQSNSAVSWNYQGTDLKTLSSTWVGGNSAYTNLVTNSAAYLSSVNLSFLSVSANWDSVYSNVNSNSANWNAAVTLAGADMLVRALTSNWESTYNTVQSNSATNWNYQGTDVKDLTSNWQSTYNTFKSASSTFLTSETDSQTLSFNEGTKTLSISNGNVVSLSALVDGTATDTSVRNLTSNWQSTYTTVYAKSANWDAAFGSAGADAVVRSLTGGWVGGNAAYTNLIANSAAYLSSVDLSFLSVSANWNSVYSNVNSNSASYATASFADSKYFPLSGGTITGATRFNDNLTVYGNISATGASYFANTVYSTTSALSVVNIGNTGPALYVGNDGTGDIASFYDIDSNVEVLHIGGNNGTYPNVGVRTSNPNKDLTVKGEISASGDIWTSGRIMSGGQDLISILTPNIDSVYNTVQSNSAINWNYQGTDLKQLSGNWQDTYTLMQDNSAAWDLAVTSGYVGTDIKVLTGNWESTYTTVNANSADWNYQGTDLKNLSSGWVGGNEAYTNIVTNSAAYLSSVDLSFLSVSSDWNSVYSNVNSNSANWDAAFSSAGTDLAVRDLTANWESTYNTFAAVSSTFLTSETDSQTLSFDQGTKDLSISNGNTISLSALVDGTAIDTAVRDLTGNWQNTLNTVQSNSATNWNYQGTDLKALSSGWIGGNSAYTTVNSNSGDWVTKIKGSSGGSFVVGNITLSGTGDTVVSQNGNTIVISSIPGSGTGGVGTVTNVSGTLPISVVNGSLTPVISIANATNSADGAMSSADKQKLDAIPANYLPLSGGTITGDLDILGNLTLNGLTAQITATNLSIEDALVFVANNNTANTKDVGLVGQYNYGFQQYSGLTRLASTNRWTLFSGVTSDPVAFSNIPVSDPTFTIETLQANLLGNVTGNATTVTNGVYTTESYSDPTWILSLSSGKVLGPERNKWDSTYTTVQSKSAGWDTAFSFVGTVTAVRALSANWQNTFTTVQSNSSTTWNYQGSDIKALSANWQNTFTTVSSNSATWRLEDFIVACSDESTNLTTSTSAVTFRVPFAMVLNSVRASVNVAPVGSTIIVDVKQTGTSIFSAKLSIDANEETSTTAATPAVISNPTLTDDAKIVVSIDQIGSTTPGRGLKLTFKGYRV